MEGVRVCERISERACGEALTSFEEAGVGASLGRGCGV